MTPAGEVRVDPDKLRTAGLACGDLRDTLGHSIADVEPETVAAKRALPGFLMQNALQDVLWWWRDDLTRFGKRLDATADALEACARDYEQADHASASHFYSAERPW